MKYMVINGPLSVEKVEITYLSTSSIFLVGELTHVALTSAFDTPPEKVIVGVSLPLAE